jgi:hypothetical protein
MYTQSSLYADKYDRFPMLCTEFLRTCLTSADRITDLASISEDFRIFKTLRQTFFFPSVRFNTVREAVVTGLQYIPDLWEKTKEIYLYFECFDSKFIPTYYSTSSILSLFLLMFLAYIKIWVEQKTT